MFRLCSLPPIQFVWAVLHFYCKIRILPTQATPEKCRLSKAKSKYIVIFFSFSIGSILSIGIELNLFRRNPSRHSTRGRLAAHSCQQTYFLFFIYMLDYLIYSNYTNRYYIPCAYHYTRWWLGRKLSSVYYNAFLFQKNVKKV